MDLGLRWDDVETRAKVARWAILLKGTKLGAGRAYRAISPTGTRCYLRLDTIRSQSGSLSIIAARRLGAW